MPEIFRTHYRRNTGIWEDSGAIGQGLPELQGTPQIIADEIGRRLEENQKVVVVEVGAMWGSDIIAVAANFEYDIEAGRLKVVLTDKEQFDPKVGIKKGYNKNTLSRLNITPELPDEATLEFITNKSYLIHRLSGVETEQLPSVLTRKGIGPVDIVVEHFGGLFHARDQKKAAEAVAQSLRAGGVVITSEFLEDVNSYGNITQTDLIPERGHNWAEICKVYRKQK